MCQGADRHSVVQRIVWILDDGNAPVRLDLSQAGGPVVAGAGQDDADYPAVAGLRGRAKQHIDARAVSVLARADGQPHVTILDHQVVVGRGDEDASRLEYVAVPGRPAGKRTCASQDPAQRARTSWGDVKHDADSGPQVWRKSSDYEPERLDAARGGADDDEVPSPFALIGHEHFVSLSTAYASTRLPTESLL